jgi:hypothetical protein
MTHLSGMVSLFEVAADLLRETAGSLRSVDDNGLGFSAEQENPL